MLLVQLRKILPNNLHIVIGVEHELRNYVSEEYETYFDTYFAGPAANIQERYDNKRIRAIYVDKCGNQVIELEG